MIAASTWTRSRVAVIAVAIVHRLQKRFAVRVVLVSCVSGRQLARCVHSMIDKVCRVVCLRVLGRQSLQQVQICERNLIVLGCRQEIAPIANRWGRSLVLGRYVLDGSVKLLAVEHFIVSKKV
jgi:hypothetical protein